MKLTSTPGILVKDNNSSTIDYSNITEGYVVVTYKGPENKKCIVAVDAWGQRQNFHIYELNTPKAIPLCFGDGEYTISVYRQLDGPRYQVVSFIKQVVKLNSQFSPYLYPNTYCEYDKNSLCTKISTDLCKGLTSDAQIISNVFKWVCDNTVYDVDLAVSIVKKELSWWLPNPDKVIREGKCVCWGYSSLTAALLRIQNIPTRICVGWAGRDYHAWNEIYSRENCKIGGLDFKANTWNMIDVTFMDGIMGDKAKSEILKFIGDGSNYKVDYYG